MIPPLGPPILGVFTEEPAKLDFSGQGLTTLSPDLLALHKGQRTLDLSGNDLEHLPDELKHFPFERIIINGNKRLKGNIPSWIGEKENLILEAYDIGLKKLPKELAPHQVECEQEVILEYWEQFAQLPPEGWHLTS